MGVATYRKAQKGETWIDLCRSVFPGWSEDRCNDFLWNQTGFPEFWRTADPRQEVLDKLLKLKESMMTQLGIEEVKQ